MQKLKIALRNCYGISNLNQEFDYTLGPTPTQIIYAQNGTMKSSLAKTFDDIASGRETVDLVFWKNPSRGVTVDGMAIEGDRIYVVHSSADVDFRSDKISTLLVNAGLREKYENALSSIEAESLKIITFLKGKLNKKSNSDVISILVAAFEKTGDDYFTLLEELEPDVAWERLRFNDLDYLCVFDPKVVSFLGTKDFLDKLGEYMKVYDKLVAWSKYFRKGVFNHNHADAVADSLRENGFFDAEHGVVLSGKDGKRSVNTTAELSDIITQEREAIINDVELKKRFDAIDKAITKNAEVKAFRFYLENHPEILPELLDIPKFKRKAIISYLQEVSSLYEVFLSTYKAAKLSMGAIMGDARREQEDWKRVIQEFNDRFYVPFKLRISNQEDVILKSVSPQLEYDYGNDDELKSLNADTLMKVLSTGERRAHYILNILFEIEARKKQEGEFLLVVDDIADSFDYGNKYAIIEYLRDIAESGKFRLLILTHNFDFFRLAVSRLYIHRKASYVASKSPETLILTPTQDLAVFNNIAYLRDHFHEDPALFVTAIPFVRNLVEYSLWQGAKEYSDLTCVLHLKEKTNDVLVSEIMGVLTWVFQVTRSCWFDDGKMIDLIFRLADQLIAENVAMPWIENKIVLSIAARIKAEQVMISEISDPWFVSSINSDQTAALFKRYKQLFGNDAEKAVKIRSFNQLLLVTSENIHVNSFMYEPILDTDERKLKQLYVEISGYSEAS